MGANYIVFKDLKTGKFLATEDTHNGLYEKMLHNKTIEVVGSPLADKPEAAIDYVKCILGED